VLTSSHWSVEASAELATDKPELVHENYNALLDFKKCSIQMFYLHLFYQLSCNPAPDHGAAENFIMDPVEAEQNAREPQTA